MQHQTLARRYAIAIFNLALAANAVDTVGRDLNEAAQVIYRNDDLRRFYLSPVFERKRKEALLLAAFAHGAGGRELHEIALHAILLLIRKRREALLPAIAREFINYARAAAGKELLEIVSAREVSPTELAAIVARFEAAYGKRFEVAQRVDPAVLGGIRLTIGDRRIDGSLAGRLSDLARTLHSQPTGNR